MSRNPNIATNEWREVASSFKKTVFFREDQLNPMEVLRILADLVRRYTTVLNDREVQMLNLVGATGTTLSVADLLWP